MCASMNLYCTLPHKWQSAFVVVLSLCFGQVFGTADSSGCREWRLLSLTVRFAHFCDSERSMGLHVRVCVRELELSDSHGVAKISPSELFPGEIMPVRNRPPPRPRNPVSKVYSYCNKRNVTGHVTGTISPLLTCMLHIPLPYTAHSTFPLPSWFAGSHLGFGFHRWKAG